MNISFKKSFMLLLTLLVLVFSALGTTPAYATWVFTTKNTSNGLGHNLTKGAFASGSNVYVATIGGLSISTDSGASFVNKTTANGLGNDTVNGVFESAGSIYAATNGGLGVSTNSGTSFTNKTTGNGLGSNQISGVFASGSNVYAATTNGLSISTNSGGIFVNKTTTDGLANNIVNGAFASGSNVYAATEGGLAISTNSGGLFTNRTTTDGLGSDVVNGVFANGSTVYAATDGGLSISTDSGATFTNKTTAQGLGDNIVNGVIESGGAIYAATENGLSISTNGGTSFSNFAAGQGLPTDQVKGLYVSGGIVYLATWSGGLSIGADLDITKPTVTAFTASSSVANFTIPITAFTASDNLGVTGYLITTSSAVPLFDAAGWSGTAPTTYTVAANGAYTLYPWAKDSANNVSLAFGSPAAVNVLDNTAPTTNMDSQPSTPSTDNTPTFTFSGSDGAGSGLASLQCKMDSDAYAACTSPFTSAALADGSHTFSVKAVDNANNEDATPATSTFVIDSTAPETSIDSQPLNPDLDNTPTFTFSGNDGVGSGVASLQCKMDAGSFAACTSPFTSSTLADGSHTFTVKAIDNIALEDATPASFTWVIDTVAPDTSILTQPSNPDVNSTPTFTFSGNDGAGSGVASFMCQMDAGSFAACTSPFTSAALPDGSHTFNVKAIDSAANADASPASYTWLLDPTAPTVSSIVRTGPTETTSALSVDFTVTFSESVTGVASADFSLSTPSNVPPGTAGVSGASVTGVSGSNATYTVTVNTGSGNGSIRLDIPNTATILDLNGNSLASLPYTSGESYTIYKGLTTAPSVPALASPVSNQLITDFTPTLDWGNSSTNGSIFDHYQVQVTTDETFSSTVTDVNVPGISNSYYTIPTDLDHNTKFYWRVRSVNLAGGMSSWSAVRYFRTIVDAPTLLLPTNTLHVLSLRPSFDWDVPSGPGAISGYTIQISKNDSFTLLVHTGNPVTSDYVPTADLPKNMQLFWRVQTKGANGPSAWSSPTLFFNSANAPSTPALSLPAANALNTDYKPKFTWSAVILPAPTVLAHYQIQVDDNADFSNPVIDDTPATNEYPILTPLLAHNTKFYWRVRAFNTSNEAGNWSAVRYFRTIVDAPVNLTLSPLNGIEALSLRPTFDWDTVAGPSAVTGYTIQVSKNNNFTLIVHTGNSVTSEYVPTADLPKGMALFWRVQTKGTNGPSAWSASGPFNSANSPTTPLLSQPALNALNTNYIPLFTWSPVTLPAGTSFKYYQLQVDDNADFSTPVIDDTSINAQFPSIGNSTIQFPVSTPLAHNTKFYWRVRAVNTGDEVGSWSTVRNFRTIVDVPAPVSPSPSSDPFTLRPTFDWNPVGGPGAVTYTIQIAKIDPTFKYLVNTGTSTTSEYVPTVDLPKDMALFWRVQATGANGPSAWSAPLSFFSANSPTTPVLNLPTANALNTNYTPLFKWSVVTLPAGTDFKYYQLQVDDNADFSSPVLDDTSITVRVQNPNSSTIQFQVSASTPLASNTKFYWRVRAVNQSDEVSNWATVRYFRTLVGAPTLLSPANASAAGSLKPVFDWADPTGLGAVTNYTVQISANPTFATLLVNTKTVNSTYTPLVDLPAGKTLYWRVMVNGVNGPSAFSSFSFTTP